MVLEYTAATWSYFLLGMCYQPGEAFALECTAPTWPSFLLEYVTDQERESYCLGIHSCHLIIFSLGMCNWPREAFVLEYTIATLKYFLWECVTNQERESYGLGIHSCHLIIFSFGNVLPTRRSFCLEMHNCSNMKRDRGVHNRLYVHSLTYGTAATWSSSLWEYVNNQERLLSWNA
jgi:hypothetical protein